jgi:hypothetical protein
MKKTGTVHLLTAHEMRQLLLYSQFYGGGILPPNVAWRYVQIRLGPVSVRLRNYVAGAK